ncbi:MAG: hypothetical protein U9R53_09735 [Chloroflexota bacterium]|nr:hypothetical protein [Chloroflexota bacterium]
MDNQFPFENFPYRKLEIKISRRNLFNSLLQQVTGIASKINEKPTYRIEDLGICALEDLMEIAPALYPGCEFKSDEDQVYGKAPNHSGFICLFPMQSAAHVIFQYFNKDLTIQELCLSLRKRFSMGEEKSQLFIRGLFLFLVEEGFAYPSAGVPDHA